MHENLGYNNYNTNISNNNYIPGLNISRNNK